MTRYFPIVFETEENGAVCAYVPGLPVYAAADGRAGAERTLRGVLAAYLDAYQRATDAAISAGFVVPEDRQAMLDDAKPDVIPQ